MEQKKTVTSSPAREPIKLSFSVPQILGGALAAATAAMVGSQLGVAGTIIGASVASVIGGIAGTLYSAGLDRTHRRVTAALRRSSGQPQAAGEGEDLLLTEDEPQTQPGATTQPVAVQWKPPSRRRLFERMVLSALAIFLVAVTAITVVELGLGRTLTGLAGTSIGHVKNGGSAGSPSTPQPTATATKTVTATAQPSPTTEPTPDPTTTPTIDPTPQPTDVTPQPVPSTS